MSRRTPITTGILWDQVPSALESEDWETTEDGDGQIRRVYIGSTMGLAPSGKFYMPWACSNLDPCPRCDGSGSVHGNTRPRDRSKARNRLARLSRKTKRLFAVSVDTGRALAIATYPARRRWERIANGSTCARCGGLGSHEAHDDETYWELLESEADEHGYFVDHSEDGDSVFIAESRAMPDDELDDDTAEPEELDAFLDAYIECALWSSVDTADDDSELKPLDDDYGPEDLAPEALASAREDCAAFLRDHATLIGEKIERAGHDFWLTRNRHGAGFWDGDWPANAGRILTDASHIYGSVDLYVGDDGKIHGG